MFQSAIHPVELKTKINTTLVKVFKPKAINLAAYSRSVSDLICLINIPKVVKC